MPEIIIKENNIKDAAKVLSTITEFEDNFSEERISEELSGKKSLVVVSYVDHNPAGCVIGFDRFGKDAFYCWLVAVDSKFRGLGLLPLMMTYQENWARNNHFKKIMIKTRNDSRIMLGYLMKDNFDVIDVHSPKSDGKGIITKYLNRAILKTIYILNGFLRLKDGDSKKNRIMLQKYL